MVRIAVLSLLASLASHPSSHASDEDAYYRVTYLNPPPDERLEVGGMDFLDRSLILSTRRGEVWKVDGALAEDPSKATFTRIADGLQEGLGLLVTDGVIHVVQRGELSRLLDLNGDDLIDRIETVSDRWGLSGNYHEFAYGLPRDPQGNFYVGLNVGFFEKWWHGQARAPYRGWVMKIAPDGETTPYAVGFRSPNGMGISPEGDVFVTDNQGDWMPVCPVIHVEEGQFYGHPGGLRWTEEYGHGERVPSDTIAPEEQRAPAAIWIPYEWSRSTGNPEWDTTEGKFGPFAGQMFLAELTNGMVLRAMLEEVDGVKQGAVLPFRQKIGSANRIRFAPDGSLIVGMTNRGWGGLEPAEGLARIRWTGEIPPEMHTISLTEKGFRVTFTRPLAKGNEPRARVVRYDYDYWWEYGSPERHFRELEVDAVEVAHDRLSLTLNVSGLQAGRVVRVTLSGTQFEDGESLLHDTFSYTINRLRGGSNDVPHVAKEVPQPPSRERHDEGWVRLMDGVSMDLFERRRGWRIADAKLDPKNPGTFEIADGRGSYVNLGGEKPDHLVSRLEFGDCEGHVEFMVPKNGNSGIYVMGNYEIQILDSHGKKELGSGDCGGIYAGEGWPGRAPNLPAVNPPGEWNTLHFQFRAPRFDESGKKIENARFERITLNDKLLHVSVELPGPTFGNLGRGESAMGPLMLQGDHGPIAYRNISIRAADREPESQREGWRRIFNGSNLDDWKISDGGSWEVKNQMIEGTGPRSHLFSPRDDYVNFELRAKVRIGSNGNSGMYFRTTYGPGWPAGYEAQINSDFQDPVKTGSLYDFAPQRTMIVPPNTWFHYHVICRDVAEGVHIQIFVNGVKITDYVDRTRRHAKGHIAFQQHHEGSIVHLRDIEVRELDR